MRRGTTPTNIFTVPFEVVNPQAVQLTYKQKDIAIERQMDDMQIDVADGKTTLTVTLTQEETLKLSARPAYIQCRIVMSDGEAVASNILMVNVGDVLDGGVLPKVTS